MGSEDAPIPGAINNVIRIDDERIKGNLDRVVRGTVEETLNSLLDVEADRFGSSADENSRRKAISNWCRCEWSIASPPSGCDAGRGGWHLWAR